MAETMITNLDPKYCYTKSQLRGTMRIKLMIYAEARWTIPRAKSWLQKPGFESLPRDYSGPWTGDYKPVEALINFIWSKYRKDGHAGEKQLLKKSPRPPEDSPPKKGRGNTSSGPAERPPSTEEDSTPQKIKIRPASDEAPPEVTESGVVYELNTRILHIEQGIATIHRKIDAIGPCLQDIMRVVLELGARQSKLATISHFLSGLECQTMRLIEGVRVKDESILSIVRDLEEVLREMQAIPKASDKSNGKSAGLDSEQGLTKYQPAPASDHAIHVTIDGKGIDITVADLLDEKRFPDKQLVKIGAAVDLDLRQVSSRVQRVGLIRDRIESGV
jgi:hypothetical protein